jgi:hypothetical protein
MESQRRCSTITPVSSGYEAPEKDESSKNIDEKKSFFCKVI